MSIQRYGIESFAMRDRPDDDVMVANDTYGEYVTYADHLAEVERVRALSEDLAAALALLLYDAHPTYANTTGWRGGIGGQAITQGCSIIDPPPGAEWTQWDLLSTPLRAYLNEHPFDLEATKDKVRAAAIAAIKGDSA